MQAITAADTVLSPTLPTTTNTIRTCVCSVTAVILLASYITSGLEVTEPRKLVLTMLNNLIDRAVYKILQVSDKDVICDIRQCLEL